jgi:hypothetical protein
MIIVVIIEKHSPSEGAGATLLNLKEAPANN